MTHRSKRVIGAAAIATMLAAVPPPSPAQTAAGAAAPPTTVVVASGHSFDALATRLEASIKANGMGLVARASASAGAAARGVSIPGNLVLMVFRNDYAVRMLEANVPAGIEAPLRLYVTEGRDGRASVSYRPPSAVFSPYRDTRLDAIASELDPVFEKIVRDAAAG